MELLSQGYRTFEPAQILAALGSEGIAELDQVKASFSELVQDTHMGDGGRYRFRRYSRFLASPNGALRALEGTTIHQKKEDNPLNGGLDRTFAPLGSFLRESAFLKALLGFDLAVVKELDPTLCSRPIIIGVHQVRIVTEAEQTGLPTPEGIHRDRERYTFQHFVERQDATGGEFRAYDENRRQIFAWLQSEFLDSVLFTGNTWHSATPIRPSRSASTGHRDIFLVDFDPAEA